MEGGVHKGKHRTPNAEHRTRLREATARQASNIEDDERKRPTPNEEGRAEHRTPNIERRTPNVEHGRRQRPTFNAQRSTPNEEIRSKLRTPNIEHRTSNERVLLLMRVFLARY
ncbi:MAG: hypothetical protein DME32_06685 [Verrucomicrobia bacterium]|nr:MAG: hypothetical protein DME32_06685 [Verrucomicrobiota bacterium]